MTLYTQPTNFPNGNVFASQNDTIQFGAFATTYDNFTSSVNAVLTSVQWTGGYFSGPPSTISSFEIKVYADSAGAPGSVLYNDTFTGNSNETFLGTDLLGTPTYSYSQDLNIPFSVQASTTYWLSIVAEMSFPPQWGWYTGTGGDGSSYQTFLGTTSPVASDFAFTINGAQPVPGPLPVAGAITAFAYCRKFRKRLQARKNLIDSPNRLMP